jgi:transcriptional regulator with XRE-family HTH domain
MPSNPTAFISYSWDDEAHKEWVRRFAAQLRADGVDARLDHWHAVPGDQLPEFMEREIRDSDFVVVVCTPGYRTKSETRVGGVGYEGGIMTAEVFTSQNHRKFIPVLARGTWDESSPSWLKGKYYIDLTLPSRREAQYHELLSTILNIRDKPPPLGRRRAGDTPLASALEHSITDCQAAFVAASQARWVILTGNLDSSAPERCPRGRYELDYALAGDLQKPNLADLFDILGQSFTRGPGSSLLFQIPRQPELQPAPVGDCIECWLNMQAVARPYRDSAYCDFWRASPEGRMFLLRGYIEDSARRLADFANRRIPEGRTIEPGTTFDLDHTIWSVGECFVHAAKVASLLAPGRGDVRVHLQAQWYGLAGRRLASIGGNRDLFGNYVCRQDEYAAATIVEVSRIEDNLPEIVWHLIVPLY